MWTAIELYIKIDTQIPIYNTCMAQLNHPWEKASEVVRRAAESYNATDLHIRNTINNYVGLVDERFVIKAPESAQSMGSLAVEAAALELLERSEPLSVAVPKVVEFSTDPVFLVTTFLPGRIIEAATLHEIPLKDRETLGHEIGAYVLSQAKPGRLTLKQRNMKYHR